VQKKTFTKWINSYLTKTETPPVKDLFVDLRDGHKLLALLEVLTNGKYVRDELDLTFMNFLQHFNLFVVFVTET
jgi:hypothetical protein